MSKSTRSNFIIRDIQRGDPITADYLRAITGNINANTRALHGPRKVSRPGVTGEDSSAVDLNFVETGRTQTATVFTDDNGDQTSINVVDSMTLTNAFGGILTLTFIN